MRTTRSFLHNRSISPQSGVGCWGLLQKPERGVESRENSKDVKQQKIANSGPVQNCASVMSCILPPQYRKRETVSRLPPLIRPLPSDIGDMPNYVSNHQTIASRHHGTQSKSQTSNLKPHPRLHSASLHFENNSKPRCAASLLTRPLKPRPQITKSPTTSLSLSLLN
jgi:hypothetical protein